MGNRQYRRRWPWLLATVIAAFAIGNASIADTVGAQTEAMSRFVRGFLKRFPKTHLVAIRPSKVGNMFEVQTAQGLLYADTTGRFLILGQIIDLQSGENLTVQRWQELHEVNFASLPLSLSIRTVHGSGQRKLAIFEDPECPYCHELERQLADIENVTIYTFLYPVEQLHPGASDKARRIWCAKNRSTAWADWMNHGVLPPDVHCAGDTLESQLHLGAAVGVNATPTLIFADGQREAGSMSKAAIERTLESTAARLARGQRISGETTLP